MRKNNKKNNVLTKDYLDKKLDRLMKYLDYRLQPLDELKKEFDKFKDSTTKSLDWLMKAQEKYDQEYIIAHEQYSRTYESLENHEKRISVLEKKTTYKAA